MALVLTQNLGGYYSCTGALRWSRHWRNGRLAPQAISGTQPPPNTLGSPSPMPIHLGGFALRWHTFTRSCICCPCTPLPQHLCGGTGKAIHGPGHGPGHHAWQAASLDFCAASWRLSVGSTLSKTTPPSTCGLPGSTIVCGSIAQKIRPSLK